MRRLSAIAALCALVATPVLAQPQTYNPYGTHIQAFTVPTANGTPVSTTNPQSVAQPGKFLDTWTISAVGTPVCCDSGVQDLSGYGSVSLIPTASTASGFSGFLQWRARTADTIYGRYPFMGPGGEEFSDRNPVTTTGTGGGNVISSDVFGQNASYNVTALASGSVTYSVYVRAAGLRPTQRATITASALSNIGLPNSQVTASANSQLLICSTACNVYGFGGSSTVAGGILLFDATTCPADGTVTPKRWKPLAANQDYEMRFDTPVRFTTGAVLCYSTTGPFTKTASATAFMYGEGK